MDYICWWYHDNFHALPLPPRAPWPHGYEWVQVQRSGRRLDKWFSVGRPWGWLWALTDGLFIPCWLVIIGFIGGFNDWFIGDLLTTTYQSGITSDNYQHDQPTSIGGDLRSNSHDATKPLYTFARGPRCQQKLSEINRNGAHSVSHLPGTICTGYLLT